MPGTSRAPSGRINATSTSDLASPHHDQHQHYQGAQRHLPGTDRLIAAIEQRAMREYGEYAEAEIKARRYFYERSLE
jgi:hypothetical protein